MRCTTEPRRGTPRHPIRDCARGVASATLRRVEIAGAGLGKHVDHQSRGLVTAVAGPDDLSFGISRMWQSIVSGPNVHTGVFRSACDAERWIKNTLQGG